MPVPIAPAPTIPTPISAPAAELTTVLRGKPARLTTLEAGLPLFEKGAHAFGVVGGASRLALQLLLVIELRLEIDAERAVEGALDESEAVRRLRREIRRGGPRSLGEPSRLDDAIDHPPLERLLGRDLFGEHGERSCPLQPDDARENEGAAAVGDDADLGERLDERRVTGREHDVAGEREVRSRSGRDAIHGADNGLLESPDRTNDRVVALPHEVAEV